MLKTSGAHGVNDGGDVASWLQLFTERCRRRGKSVAEILWDALLFDRVYLWRLCNGERKNPSKMEILCLSKGLELGPGGTDILLILAGYGPLKGRQWYREVIKEDPDNKEWIKELYRDLINGLDLDLNLPYRHVPEPPDRL